MVAYFAFHFFSGGNLTEQGKQLKQLEKEYDAVLSQYQQYLRMAGVSGMDVTFDVGDVVSKVEKMKKELLELSEQLTDESLVEKAVILRERMDKFLSDKR